MHQFPGHGHHHARGWSPGGPRRRWLEPFVLVLLAAAPGHGYSLLGRLNALGVAADDLDVGQVYRTLRELELSGLLASRWQMPDAGAARREYVVTDEGLTALDDWARVMRERDRLVGEFLDQYGRLGRAADPETDSGEPTQEV
jgi:PadR family transcriptional regulator PadR